MTFRNWNGICLCAAEPLFPPDAKPAEAPFAPLVFLVRRDAKRTRGLYAITSLAELDEPESVNCLRPCRAAAAGKLDSFVRANGAAVLNTAFANCFAYLRAFLNRKKTGLRVTLVGLGDVGGTVLTGLTLLGREIASIALYDPNEAQCRRYEMEMNQVLADSDGRIMPEVTVCSEAALFDCDVFINTAAKGVPGLGTQVRDVRMAQYEANQSLLAFYAKKARDARFTGLFCQVADPVDHLSRAVFLASNRDSSGTYDFSGLLPEQVQGYGLGVMAARAAYYAKKSGVDFRNGRVYGPHGNGLVVANGSGADYDDAVSQRLTLETCEANLRVRELGFKPYIAPGLSSAAVSVLRTLRGEAHYGAVPLDGAYFGCVSRLTPLGVLLQREEICAPLMERIAEAHRELKEFAYE